jgi:WD40 repeat protein
VGTDGNVCFYDGKDMTLIKKVENVHKSSIFSCAWSRYGTHLLTSGADGFARLIDASSGEVVHEWDVAFTQAGENENSAKVPMGAMLLGCTFIKGDVPIAVGFNGQIVVLSVPSSLGLSSKAEYIEKPLVITGHQAPISAMTFGACGIVYTADTDGVIVEWDRLTGTPNGRVRNISEEDSDLTGKVHAGATVTSLAFSAENGTLYSAGWDDFIRISRGQNCVHKLKMEAQPNAMTCGTSLVVVMTVDGLVLVKEDQVISEMIRLPYNATAVFISKDESMLYVGGEDCNIYIYNVSCSDRSNPLVESHVIKGEHLQPVHSLALSHDGTKLAAADVRDVCVYSAADYSTIVPKGRWCFHTQKIGCLTWSQDDSVLASGGNDDEIYLWSVQKKMKRIHYRFAHRGGVTGLRFIEGNAADGNGDMMLVSVGNDGSMNFWNVKEDVNKKFK